MSTYDISDFQAEVIDRSHQVPVVVDFWAEWCGPCKMLGPVLEKLAGEANGRWQLAKLDTEGHPRIAAAFAIRSIPAVKLFVDGEVVSEFVGALPEETIRQWLNEVIPGPEAGRMREARELLTRGDEASLQRARRLLEEALEVDAGNVEARVLLAEALVFDDAPAATALLEPIGAGDKHGDRAEALRTVARLLTLSPDSPELGDSPAKNAYFEAIDALSRRDLEGALAGFVYVAGQDRQLDDDGARNACLAIFTLLGDEAAETREYRKQLARALFV
ncbi:MAG: thioredoxin [Acidobacteriota bacterium]|jgi:putative thioredoxin